MTAKRRPIGSDLAKADARVVTAEDYEENPEWTKEDFARAVPHIGGRRVSKAAFRRASETASKGGRAKSEHAKKAVNLPLAAERLGHCRARGPARQRHIHAARREGDPRP